MTITLLDEVCTTSDQVNDNCGRLTVTVSVMVSEGINPVANPEHHISIVTTHTCDNKKIQMAFK
jgi:hypothetical protein